MSPEPTISFTLPSLHDKTTLTCRIYHPLLRPTSPTRRRRAAVFAHPYAPLGGCYDDVVVGEVVDALLSRGYIVGTFNFRGAGKSSGRTSWTSKPERGDYMTLAGFMAHYLHHLQQPESPKDKDTPILLLGGYSYGALITSQLPPLPEILSPFIRPALGTPAAEVRLRAQHLAEHQRAIMKHTMAAAVGGGGGGGGERSPRRSMGMRVGGNEVDEDKRRSFSMEAEEKIRKGIGEVLARTGMGHKVQVKGEEDRAVECLVDVHLATPKVAYLLISPLQGVISHLATMSIFPSPSTVFSKLFPGRPHHHTHKEEGESPAQEEVDPAEQKMIQNPTLAVFGDADIFVSAHKLRSWAGRMQGAEGSRFRALEVKTAGHFWVEEGVMDRLARGVVEFSRALVEDWEGA